MKQWRQVNHDDFNKKDSLQKSNFTNVNANYSDETPSHCKETIMINQCIKVCGDIRMRNVLQTFSSKYFSRSLTLCVSLSFCVNMIIIRSLSKLGV